MARIARSRASLRVTGDALIPDEISKLLQCKPTAAYAKGDVRIGKVTGRKIVYPSGGWRLKAQLAEPEDLDGQIAELLGKLNCDLSVWERLSSRFRIDLFVGLFMEGSNEGMEISAESLKMLGDRGIVLGLDIYGLPRCQKMPNKAFKPLAMLARTLCTPHLLRMP